MTLHLSMQWLKLACAIVAAFFLARGCYYCYKHVYNAAVVDGVLGLAFLKVYELL